MVEMLRVESVDNDKEGNTNQLYNGNNIIGYIRISF